MAPLKRTWLSNVVKLLIRISPTQMWFPYFPTDRTLCLYIGADHVAPYILGPLFLSLIPPSLHCVWVRMYTPILSEAKHVLCEFILVSIAVGLDHASS